MRVSSIFTLLLLAVSQFIQAQDYKAINRAKELYDEGKFPETLALLDDLSETDSEGFDFWLLKGNCLQKSEKFVAAVQAYEKAEKFNDKDALLYANWSAAYFNLNQMGEAEKNVKKSLKLNPDLPEGHYFLGNLQYNDYKVAAAIKSYTRAVQLRPDYRDAIFMRAASHAEVENYSEAMRDYKAVITLDPNLVVAKFNTAVIFLVNEEYANAAEIFLMLKPSDLPSKKDYHYYLGEALYFSGKKEEACENYAIASELGDTESAEIHHKYCLSKEERQKPLEKRTIRATF